MNQLRPWSDEWMEQVIGNLLRLGVLVAVLFVLVGGTIYLLRHGADQPEYHVFRGEPTELTTPGGVLTSASQEHGRGIIQLGLLLLILTPIARVAFSLLGFALQQDVLYVVVTSIVLVILMLSLTNHLP